MRHHVRLECSHVYTVDAAKPPLIGQPVHCANCGCPMAIVDTETVPEAAGAPFPSDIPDLKPKPEVPLGHFRQMYPAAKPETAVGHVSPLQTTEERAYNRSIEPEVLPPLVKELVPATIPEPALEPVLEPHEPEPAVELTAAELKAEVRADKAQAAADRKADRAQAAAERKADRDADKAEQAAADRREDRAASKS